MNVQVSIFFAVSTLVLTAGYLYLGRKLIPSSREAHLRRRAIAWTGLGLLFLAVVAGNWVYRGYAEVPLSGQSWRDVLYWLSYTVMGFVFLLFFFFVVTDLVLLGGRLVRRVATGKKSEAPRSESRRRFFRRSMNYGVTGFAGVLTGLGAVQAVRGPRVERVSVAIDGLSSEFEGLTIAQISDLHVGPTIRREYVERVVEAVNALSPDLIAVTGDMIDGTVVQLDAHVAPLASLQAREGVFYVSGNHEYYWGIDQWLEKFASLGMRVLQNSHAVISRGTSQLVVAGVSDYSAGRFIDGHRSDPARAAAGAPAGAAKLLLAHQPRSCYAAEKAGFDLQLSGHTHAGQFFPWGIFVRFAHPFVKGLGRMDRLQVYVNAGTGYWGPPNRLGIPSEITFLTLTRA